MQEVESLLCQLTIEQQQLDALRAMVAEEREAIALETEQVLIMKEVHIIIIISHVHAHLISKL